MPKVDGKKIYENQQTISVPSGDYVMVSPYFPATCFILMLFQLDIVGNKTDGKDIFKEDLVPGETIIKEFNVNLRPPVIRNMFMFYLLTILTLVCRKH